MSLNLQTAKLLRALGEASSELLYAAAELRSAAGRNDIDSRALLYNLADSLETAAVRLQEARMGSETLVQESGD